MSGNTTRRVRERVDSVYRSESCRVFAILIRLVGDFDLAGVALHAAFGSAPEQWTRDDVPLVPLDDAAARVEAAIYDSPAYDGHQIHLPWSVKTIPPVGRGYG